MCFQEFIGYSCGHCSMSVLRPCPLTTSEHKNPVCDLQSSRPFIVDMMCPVCSRVMHSRAVLIQEWEHHFLHERGACGCDVIFPDLIRPRVIGGPSVFQKNVQEGGHADATAADGKKAPPMFEQFVGHEGQEAFAIRLSSLYAAEWVDDHAELHRKGECKCNADFNRYKPEWVDGATEPQYHCREWRNLHHTGAQRTIDGRAGPVPQFSLTHQQDVQDHAQPQASDYHEQEQEHQEQAQDNNNKTQDKSEAQEDEEQPQVYYATPVLPSKRPSRRSLSADITRSTMFTCDDEEYDDFDSSSPVGGSSASEAGEPHLYHVRRRQRRASSVDMQLNSSASDQSQGSPIDGNTSGNTDIGVQNSGDRDSIIGDATTTAPTTDAQETHKPATPVTTTVADVTPAEEASSRRHVTFSDEVVQRQSGIDSSAQDDDDDDMFPAPPTTLPGPGEVHMYPAGPKYSKYWGPNIFPRPQDDVFRYSATAQQQQQQGQDTTATMSNAMGQMQLQSSQSQDATSAPASCSRGLRVGDVNSLTSLAPMRYPTGTIVVDSNGAPAVDAKSNLGKGPSCKPIAGLPVGAGPEGMFRHMPAFGDCALKKQHPKGVRTRLYN